MQQYGAYSEGMKAPCGFANAKCVLVGPCLFTVPLVRAVVTECATVLAPLTHALALAGLSFLWLCCGREERDPTEDGLSVCVSE
jgi:hypothetical protein